LVELPHVAARADGVPGLHVRKVPLARQEPLFGFEESQATAWERRHIDALSIATTAEDGSTLQVFVRGLASAVTAWSTNAAAG
jgi:hypothetical protein